MEKLFFILSKIAITSYQDGFNFQGAAVDANGDELQNQSITIKTSVLSDSTSGATVARDGIVQRQISLDYLM